MPRFEFEDQARFDLTDFVVANNVDASGNQVINVLDPSTNILLPPGTGTATTTFDLPSGLYQVVVRVADETDGNSTFDVTIGDQTFPFSLDDPNPGASVVADQLAFKELTISDRLFIAEGTQITLEFDGDREEFGRFDYIDFNLVNEAPVAVDDTATTGENTPVDIDVLANDTDADGEQLTLNINNQGANGTAEVNDVDGTITYTPNADFTGTDTFTYEVSDDNNPPVSATVNVEVTNVNQPPEPANDTATTTSNTAVDINVLANDSDPDSDPLTVTIEPQEFNGTAEVNQDNTITYRPNGDFTGTDTFTYQVSDGTNPAVTATVNVEVTNPNQPPVPVDDTTTTALNTAVTINVLGNDTDADGDDLTVTIEPQEFNGTAEVNQDNTITYRPNGDFTGTDTFTYQVSDGTNPAVTATVNVEVTNPNQPPAPVDDTATTTSNTAVTIDVLGNDTDADGDGLTVTIEQQEFNGTAVVNQDGTITYTPNNGFTGTDTFTYQVSDGVNDPVTATVNVNVTAVNQPPVATNNNNTATTEPNTQVTIDVLANYSDPDGDPLTFAIVTNPSNGSAVVNPNNTPNDPTDDFIIYTPNADFTTGTDSLTVEVSDGNGGTSTATVNITIEDGDPVPSTLTQNANNTFTITGDTAGQSQLQFTLTGREAGEVNEIGVFAVDSAEGTINGIAPRDSGYVQAALSRAQTIFSVLPDGLGSAQPTRIINNFDVNDNLVFYVIQGGSKDGVLAGQDPTSNVFFSGASFNSDGQNHVRVTDNGNGSLTLRFEDGFEEVDEFDFNDATVVVSDASSLTPPVGTGTSQIQGERELLDLRDVTGTVTGSFVINSEASFNNTIGWYRIDDESGTVNGISVGDAGYAEAALSNRVDLSAGVSGGVILAPFLISDGTVEEFLNPSNVDQEDSELNAYFAFLGGNPDGVDHLRLVGDNTFAWEDQFGGGDQDYNDVVVQVSLSVA
ncbi:Ig-like domain-containing protein [Moorena producens JHB]|uniref:Ig-like domain-containing protein n=1 Tax=Moorena producens (strain JHB) TaxID=1454205 RepID=A0A1D9G1R6_MOOP1|nr:Ig-like domain-containing protein [Moorena producens]AOY81572.1 Ig-like domain-containing protein [Moorena producens JHB]